MSEVDTNLWRADMPLIFFHVVEVHLPYRVYRQFGRWQPNPLMEYSMNQTWHKWVT